VNRARIAAELPPDVAAALAALDAWDQTVAAETWDHVTRTLILRLARDLLADDGLGWNRTARAAFVTATASPALRAVVPPLPLRQWSRHTVVTALCAHFELFGAADTLRQAV